jgi:conjugative transfer pilus assembly protein TraH
MKVRCNRFFTWKIVAFSVAMSMSFNGAVSAGFMEDFYISAGASANITPAQAYQTQSLGVITGGGLVWRTPQRNFQPFYFTPPSLRAGCGGIDVFLGAFGLANRQQFVQFLRNVGQNASGLAFKVALQAMAPELESKIQEVATYINDWNKHFGNSCSAAKALMDAGPSRWIKEQVQRAKLNMMANGASSDYSEASDEVDANGANAIANAPTHVNSGGKTITAPEINVLWAAFNAGNMGLDDSEKELMMALVGTTVLRKVGSGADMTLQPESYPVRISLHELVGDPLNSSATIPTYSCGGDSDKCMFPRPSTRSEKPFARIVYEKAKGLQDAIINRTAPNQNDLRLLTVTTSMPMYKIIQVSAMPSRAYFGNDLLEQYSMAVAWEIAARYIEDLARNIDKMLTTAVAQDDSINKVEALERIRSRLEEVRREMKMERDEIYQQINKSGAMIAQIEHIERYLYGSLSSQIASSLRFGR